MRQASLRRRVRAVEDERILTALSKLDAQAEARLWLAALRGSGATLPAGDPFVMSEAERHVYAAGLRALRSTPALDAAMRRALLANL